LDHKVESWLVEGLTRLVSAAHDVPLDDLEEAVGTSAAYRIAGIRLKAGSGATVTSICVSETRCASFPLTALHCGSCGKPMVTADLGCRSCSKPIERDILGTIYVSPRAQTSSVYNNDHVGGHCFHLNTRHINCTFCWGPALLQGIACPSCNKGHAETTNIYLALFSPTPPQAVPSAEDLVRQVFQNEINECEV
jgi:hypothetical protein